MTDLKEAIQQAAKARGVPTRRRALFYNLGRFVVAGDRAHDLAARTIIGEALGVEDEVVGISDNLLDRMVMVAGVMRSAFEDDGSGLLWADPIKGERALHDIAGRLPELLVYTGTRAGGFGLVPRIAMGEIFTDGIDVIMNDLPIAKCPWCHSRFIPPRSDAKFCRASCRTAFANAAKRNR